LFKERDISVAGEGHICSRRGTYLFKERDMFKKMPVAGQHICPITGISDSGPRDMSQDRDIPVLGWGHTCPRIETYLSHDLDIPVPRWGHACPRIPVEVSWGIPVAGYLHTCCPRIGTYLSQDRYISVPG